MGLRYIPRAKNLQVLAYTGGSMCWSTNGAGEPRSDLRRYRFGVCSVEFGFSVPFCFFFWLRFFELLVELSLELGSFV